jgi:AcrR family transcriptional regulator
MRTADTQPPPSRRRPRMTADEVRAQMLETAYDMAMETGIRLSVDDLSLEEVIQRARVPRSSVYRLWPYKDAFINDLLCHMAGSAGWFRGGDAFDPQTFDVVHQVIDQHTDLLTTPQGRRAVLCEVVRQAVARNFTAFQETTKWRNSVALMATIDPAAPADSRIAATLDDAETMATRSVGALIEEVMTKLGLRLCDPARTVEHLVIAGRVVVQGLAVRYNLALAMASLPPSEEPSPGHAIEVLGDTLPGPGIGGQQAEWTLAAIAYLGLVDTFLEPDPDFRIRDSA